MAQAGTQSLEALMPRCGAWTVFRVPQGGTQGMRNGGTQTKQIFFFWIPHPLIYCIPPQNWKVM